MPAVVNTILPGLPADILFGTGNQHKVTGKGTEEIINSQLKLTQGQILAIQIKLKLSGINKSSVPLENIPAAVKQVSKFCSFTHCGFWTQCKDIFRIEFHPFEKMNQYLK